MAVDSGRPTELPNPAGFVISQLSARTGLRLSGEADRSCLDLLRQAAAALPCDAGEIHLQLASLEFIDVAAARELVVLTSRPARPRLVLHYPPPVMLRLLRLCWPEARARIAIGAARPDSTWPGHGPGTSDPVFTGSGGVLRLAGCAGGPGE